MKRGIIILILFVVLIIPQILASTTDVHINTLKDRKISVIILKSGETYSRIESFHKNTGNGNLTFSGSWAVNKIDIDLTLRRDGVTVIHERLTDIEAGKLIYINFIPGNIGIVEKTAENDSLAQNITSISEPLQDSNLSEEINQAESNQTSNSPISGSAIDTTSFSMPKINWKIVFYILGVFMVLILVVGVFLIFKKRQKGMDSKIYFGSKSSRNYKLTFTEQRALKTAEEKVKKAQEEIDKIRNRDQRIREVEKRLTQDKAELEKLKKGRW